MTKDSVQKSLSTYFDSIKSSVEQIAKGDTDLLFNTIYKMYDPFEEKESLSMIHVYTVFEKTMQFLSTTMKKRFDIETIKINGRKWELVTNIETGKQMPIMIDGIADTTPKMVAGKIIFFILMETL